MSAGPFSLESQKASVMLSMRTFVITDTVVMQVFGLFASIRKCRVDTTKVLALKQCSSHPHPDTKFGPGVFHSAVHCCPPACSYRVIEGAKKHFRHLAGQHAALPTGRQGATRREACFGRGVVQTLISDTPYTNVPRNLSYFILHSFGCVFSLPPSSNFAKTHMRLGRVCLEVIVRNWSL